MLRVGTDCSGIEAPIQALKNLGIPFKHVFSSEIDKFCIQSIKANYNPEIIFGGCEKFPDGDIRNRKMEDIPDIDLYVCGFPCQPFSAAGKRKGLEDTRGNVFFSCLEVIKNKEPKYFILENVKGILSQGKGKSWSIILNALQSLEKYNVDWKVLNTRDYGIPQNRERVFIVGIRKDLNKTFTWPEKVEMKKLEDFVDWEDDNRRDIAPFAQEMMRGIPEKSFFIDFSFIQNKHKEANKYTSCMITSNRFWCVPKSRYANCKELLKLQGFKDIFKQVVSIVQFKKQIGNSMSVNVLEKIITILIN